MRHLAWTPVLLGLPSTAAACGTHPMYVVAAGLHYFPVIILLIALAPFVLAAAVKLIGRLLGHTPNIEFTW